jgi:DinB superfamily
VSATPPPEPGTSGSAAAPGRDLAARLHAAAGRIRANLGAWRPGTYTEADPATGERWEAGQVLAHVAEMLPYWVRQAETVAVGADGDPFGRVKTDPDRVAAIERDRRGDLLILLGRMDQGVAGALALLDRLDAAALARTGTHPTLGRMTVAQIIEEFLVRHLEEHADQLAHPLTGPPDA